MAASATSSAVVLSNEPVLITEIPVTLTGTGGSLSVAHGGPKGRTPFKTEFVGTSVVGGVVGLSTTTDTVNDEVDLVFVASSSLTGNATGKVLCHFLPKAADIGREAPIGYAPASNANF